MSNRVTWPPTDPTIVSYELERGAASVGPWSVLATIPATEDTGNFSNGRYFYVDTTGQGSDWYRLVAINVDGLRSQPSQPFQAVQPFVGTNLSIATARFMSPDGQPQKRSIIIAADGTQNVAGFVVADSHPLVMPCDDDGFLQISLVQGTRIRVAIEGTGVVKSIVVPSTPTFDLLQAMTDAPDPFTIQTVPPLLTKRHV